MRGFVGYNKFRNSMDIFDVDTGNVFRLRCDVWEEGLKTTLNSQGALDALAIDNPKEYIRLMLSGGAQVWIDAQDSLYI